MSQLISTQNSYLLNRYKAISLQAKLHFYISTKSVDIGIFRKNNQIFFRTKQPAEEQKEGGEKR